MNHTRNSSMDQQNYSQHNEEGNEGRLSLSREEERIRDELEMEIERNLEGEIKDKMYKLAIKLRRLYQQRREREESNEVSSKRKSKRVIEVNISIKMEGETKIEITERKKEAKDEDNKITRKKLAAGEFKIRKDKMRNQTRSHELRWRF